MDNESSHSNLQGSESTNAELTEDSSPPPQPPAPHLYQQLAQDLDLHVEDVPQQPGSPQSSSSSDNDDNENDGNNNEDDENVNDNDDDDDDDGFHDAHADSDDEAWVLQQLMHIRTEDTSSASTSTSLPPCTPTESRVSCPQCFVTLSLQCQAHVRYAGQYRALLVRNCRVADNSRCSVRVLQDDRYHGRNQLDEESATESTTTKEKLRDVLCTCCGTRVGVRETDTGVYHLCNVVSGF